MTLRAPGGMPVNDLPQEIISQILLLATKANETVAENFTYGLTAVSFHGNTFSSKPTRYVRGPLNGESQRWDATNAIRRTCRQWHSWALAYCLEHIYERLWRGSERWAELSQSRQKYRLYELIEKPSGHAVYRDPYGSLKATARLFNRLPHLTQHVRRIWFNGFHVAETDQLILSIIASCSDLQFISIPWTILRRGTAEQWINLLNVGTGRGVPLYSLELQAVSLTASQACSLENDSAPDPLLDPRVTFNSLRRLKFFGNTLHKPITDRDLRNIARTATDLVVLDITNLSTITVAGMLGLVEASRKTLQVLEHSPRSDDGFYHPHPGNLSASDASHVCTLLASLPSLRDLSISVPSMCADLFNLHADDSRWEGECQVRAADLCPECCPLAESSSGRSCCILTHRIMSLRAILHAARTLIAARARMHSHLSIEIFFAGCIFEPEKFLVHGDFHYGSYVTASADLDALGDWQEAASSDSLVNRYEVSTKGPYGTTGIYGKEGEGNWSSAREEQFFDVVERGLVAI